MLLVRDIAFKFLLLAGFVTLPLVAFSQNLDIDDNQSETNELTQLFEEISRNPDNLNNNYRYAKLAEKMGKYYESIAAYERMLIQSPSLDRVKLDLALLYFKVGSMDEAKKLFLEVKSKNPPAQVAQNINKFLAQIDGKNRKHSFGANVTLGYGSDSNPSASPSSGSVDVFGVGIPVDDATSGQSDDQKFAHVRLTHSTQVPYVKNTVWSNEASFYKAVQDNASSLNTTVYALKTGVSQSNQNGRLRYGAHLNCSNVNLAEHEYLNTYGYDVFMDYIMSRKAKLRLSHSQDYRKFQNSPTVTTYEDRNGRASEDKLSLTAMVTPKDIVNASLSLRREHAGVDYYTNRSRSFGLNYTRLLENGFYMTGGATFKRTKYKDVDSFVNPFVVREDNERTWTVGLGKNITSNLTCGFVYQDKKIESNIQNYEYTNERITATLSWRY